MSIQLNGFEEKIRAADAVIVEAQSKINDIHHKYPGVLQNLPGSVKHAKNQFNAKKIGKWSHEHKRIDTVHRQALQQIQQAKAEKQAAESELAAARHRHDGASGAISIKEVVDLNAAIAMSLVQAAEETEINAAIAMSLIQAPTSSAEAEIDEAIAMSLAQAPIGNAEAEINEAIALSLVQTPTGSAEASDDDDEEENQAMVVLGNLGIYNIDDCREYLSELNIEGIGSPVTQMNQLLDANDLGTRAELQNANVLPQAGERLSEQVLKDRLISALQDRIKQG